MMKAPNRYPLAHLPTPLEPLARLSAVLGGPQLWIKRDDQTGLATGGNKTRKLELLIADALAHQADVVLTVGAVQSNHCRQTAAAAARAGLGCVLVLRGDAPPRAQWIGNLLLDSLLGARLWWAGANDPLQALAAAAEAERAAGRTPYVIPYGGSNAVGASAYALAFEELWAQMQALDLHFDRVVFATSSGGTQAGLVVGAAACGYPGQVLGISVDKTGGHLRETVAALLGADGRPPRPGPGPRPRRRARQRRVPGRGLCRADRRRARGGPPGRPQRGHPPRPGLHRQGDGRAARPSSARARSTPGKPCSFGTPAASRRCMPTPRAC